MKCQWHILSADQPIFTDGGQICNRDHSVFVWVDSDRAVPLCNEHGVRLTLLTGGEYLVTPSASTFYISIDHDRDSDWVTIWSNWRDAMGYRGDVN